MQPTQIEQYVIDEEGYRQKPYRCTAGKLTIGYGFNLDDVGLSRDESLLILRLRLDKLAAELTDKFSWFLMLRRARQAALLGMAYQMGLAGLYGFKTTLACIEAANYEQAARNMLQSKWAQQTPARARRAAYMMRYGTFPE